MTKRIPEGYTCLKLHQSYLKESGKNRGGTPQLRCYQCLKEKKQRYNIKNKDHISKLAYERGRRHLLKTKIECFEAYGGVICNCCGETHLAFLTLDHINDNGTQHRKQISAELEAKNPGKKFPYRLIAGITMYKYLRDLGYPSGFQVLCSNCNHAKQNWPGGCPHQTN